MARTQIDGLSQIESGTISRSDLNTATTGSAVITKVIAGTGVTISQTGVDDGTGDVTINAVGASFTGGILSSNLELMAGTTAAPPLSFQAGTSLTSATAGALEFDGTYLYITPSTVRQTIATQSWVSSNSVTSSSPTFTGVATFAASGIRLNGSSSGYTTFTSSNTSSTNYTLTFPAITDTVATISTINQLAIVNALIFG